MAHVRAVRQIIVAVKSCKQPIQIAGLVRAAAGAVENHALAVRYAAKLAANFGKRGADFAASELSMARNVQRNSEIYRKFLARKGRAVKHNLE